MEEFPLKWHFLPLLYHYLSLPKGWKHDSIWFLNFRQRAELLYAFSPLLVVKNPYLCRVKSGVIQRLRKYIQNKSQVLSKSTSNSCIRSKADILALIQTILVFLSVGSIPIRGKEKCYVFYLPNQISSTLISNSLIQINPAVELLWNHPLIILCPCYYSHLHNLVSHVLWLQSLLRCKSLSGPLILSLHSKSKPECWMNVSTSLLLHLDYSVVRNSRTLLNAIWQWVYEPQASSVISYNSNLYYFPVTSFLQNLNTSHFRIGIPFLFALNKDIINIWQKDSKWLFCVLNYCL